MDYVNPITVSRRSSREERETALNQIYRQVLERQPYARERKSLAKAEKDFLSDKIGVRRFLKELGQSEIYLDSFYYNSTNLKFIESCFKHFMGRAPIDHAEVHQYCNVLLKNGVNALITLILDSEEYRKVFGCFTVPYPQQHTCYSSPKSYLESDLLNREHFAQRGRMLPTLYWHQLRLNCEGGTCVDTEDDALSSADRPSASAQGSNPASTLQDELMELLNALSASEAKELVSTIAKQRAPMRRPTQP